MHTSNNGKERLAVVRIVATYALFGALWIYLSDSILGWMVQNTAIMTRIAVFKGLLFIILTAVLLYFLIARYAQRLRRAEESLREREELYRNFTQLTSDYVYSCTRSEGEPYRVHWMGGAVEAISGYSQEEIIARGCWLPLVHPEDVQRVSANLMALRPGMTQNDEFRIMAKNGDTRWIHESSRCEAGAAPGELLLFGTSQDITLRKQAELALRESEESLKTIMELMPVGVSWSNVEGRVEYLNRHFVERFGYSLGDIPTVEEWFRQAYPDPDYRQMIVAEWQSAIDEARKYGARVRPVEARVTCKDGSVRQVIINAQFIQERTLVILTDITEREHLQNELLKAQKIESLGVLAGGIAHDFNNILTGILGYISIARMLVDPGHKSHKALTEAEKASMRAAELAHQLLTFARGGEPVKRAVSVAKVVNESVSLVLRGSNVKAVLDLPDLIHPVEADEGQLSQACNNIIINAIQAMPGGGTLTVRAENVTVADRNGMVLLPGEYVRICFTDEGCGIRAEDLKKIFDPYFTTKPAGTGLGLASVYSIVKRHGGHIEVRSSLGEWTTFCLYLPASSMVQPLPESNLPETVEISMKHCSLLVMDDDATIRELAAEMLTSGGYLVETASSGEEAIARYRAAQERGTPYAAVIMDLTIPGGMSGKVAAEQILALDPQACLVVSSGYSNDPVMASYGDYGFCAAIAKPYSAQQLLACLQGLLEGRH